MKNLVFAALCCAGLAQFATGCVVVEPSTITATWSLVSGDNNAPTDCPAGATTIGMVSLGANDQLFVDLFDCEAGAGTTADMPVGAYYTYLNLQDDSGNILYAQSRGTDVTVFEEGDSPLTFEFSIDRGEFGVSWIIADGGVASDCDSVLATEFVLDHTDANGDLYASDHFPCTDLAGVTPVIPLGDWTVSPSIIDDTQLAIAVGDPIDASIEYGNHFVQLGTVILDVQGP